MSPCEVHSEDDQAGAVTPIEGLEDPLNWQRLVSREVLAGLPPLEVKRQEVINGEVYSTLHYTTHCATVHHQQ